MMMIGLLQVLKMLGVIGKKKVRRYEVGPTWDNPQVTTPTLTAPTPDIATSTPYSAHIINAASTGSGLSSAEIQDANRLALQGMKPNGDTRVAAEGVSLVDPKGTRKRSPIHRVPRNRGKGGAKKNGHKIIY